MDKHISNKKMWVKPSVNVLNIRKDTFGGSQVNTENLGNGAPNVPRNPTPRG